MTCELSNWTGKAFKIPRRRIKDSSDRPELESTGVYILFGKSDKLENKGIAYIGEAEGIYKRLNQQLSSKEFWNDAIIFVSKDENLNKAHIKYLESRLYEIALKVDRYEIENSVIPTKSSISESDQSEMEEFIENIRLLVNTLGYNIFEEIRQISNITSDTDTQVFYIQAARGADAKGQLTNEGFAVLKGSKIATSLTNSFPKNWIRLRESLIDESIVAHINGEFIFTRDYLFSSPSAAAIVMGRSANGLTEWKLSDGRVLKAIES